MPSVVFAGSKVKTLKDTLTLNGKSDIISSTVDPTASAVDAPIGSLLINQTSGKLYRKLDAGSSVNWEEVGAGVGGINYILNPSAEVNTTGWATYADAAGAAPVDGTGGSPNVTWTRSTTSPLRGVADFNFSTPGGGSVQGQGVSYDFTIDEADKAKVLSVTFDYEVLSGTYADGDLTVYLIADPTGTPVVIQPAGFTVQSATVGTTMREVATFQTQATGTSYRLCFHVASTSASAYTLAIDNVVVGPQQTVQGAAVSDWVSYTPTITTTSGTMTNFVATGFWKREGDNLKVSAQIRFTGAVGTWAGPEISIPSGLNIDFAKAIYNDGAGNLNIVSGMGRITRPGVSNYTLSGIAANVFGTNKFRLHNKFTVDAGSVAGVGEPLFDSSSAGISNLAPLSLTTNDVIWIQEVTLPIQGWSSNTVLSQDTDTRVVAASYAISTANTPGSLFSTRAVVRYATRVTDTHSAYNTSTGQYTVPVSGQYRITAQASFDHNEVVGNSYSILIQTGQTGSLGSVRSESLNFGVVAAIRRQTLSTSTVLSLNAGDTINIAAYDTNTSPTIFNSLTEGRLSIERLSGPATIAASETVAVSAGSSAGGSLADTIFTYIDFPTTAINTHNAVLGAGSGNSATYTNTWRFIAPISGIYSVSANLTFVQAAATTSSFDFLTIVARNGSSVLYGQRTLLPATLAGAPYGSNVSGLIRVNAGDAISIIGYQDNPAGTTRNLEANSAANYVSIVRVGN